MNRLFRPHRSAETFSSLVEGGHRDDLDREHAELLELVGALRSTARVQPRPEFVADLRERLMVAAEAELTPAPARATTRTDDDVARLTVRPSRGGRERRVGLALGTLAIMGATTSMAVASQGAIPGDTLYPLKRAIENTETGISRGDDAKGESMLGNASGRLDEVGALSRTDKPDAELIAQTLSTFSDQAAQAGDHLLSDYAAHGNAASIEELHAFTQTSVGTLGDLEATVPPGARDELVAAAQQVFTLDALAANACPDCGEPLLELPAQLVNGVTGVLDDTTDALAGAAGGAPSNDQEEGGQPEVKQPSGLEPPTDPVSIPPIVPTPSAGVPVDVPAPGGGTAPNNGGGSTGNQNNGGGNGGNGNGGTKPTTPVPPVDLSPVTDTVNEVLTGVLEGVGGLVGGLTGPLLGGGTATPAP